MPAKTRFINKLFIVATMVALTASIFPVQNVYAEDNVTTIVAKTEHGFFHKATISNKQERVKISVDLEERDSSKLVFHTQTAEANYKLRFQLDLSSMSPAGFYDKLTYEKATISVDGDVGVVRHDANPEECCNNEKSGPGLTFLTVTATTDEDERTPPREVRPYKMTLHLTGVKAVGIHTADLGNYDIVYPLEFVFVHNLSDFPGNSVRRFTRCGDKAHCIWYGKTHFFDLHHPTKTGSDRVEGPTPVLACEKIDDVELCEPQDNNCQEGIDESFPEKGDPCDENDADQAEPPVLLIIPPGENSYNVQPFDFPLDFPQDFFGPGSEPFVGNVTLGVDADVPDTVVERLGPIELAGERPRTDDVPAEIVALSLTSVEPITVNFNDGSQQQWDVQLYRSVSPQIDQPDEQPSPGEMTITESFVGGGTFDSHFNIYADIRLVQIPDDIALLEDPISSDPGFEVEIPNEDGQPEDGTTEFLIGERVELKAELTNVPWTVCPGTSSDFCPDDLAEIKITIPQDDPVTFPSEDEEPIACGPAVCGSDPVDDDTGCDSTTDATDCGCYPDGTECADGEDPVAEEPIVNDPVIEDPIVKDPTLIDPIFVPGTDDEYETGLLA